MQQATSMVSYPAALQYDWAPPPVIRYRLKSYGPFVNRPKRAVPSAQRRQRMARRVTRLHR